MYRRISVVSLLLLSGMMLGACSQPAGPKAGEATSADITTYNSRGVVRSVDVDAGTITVAHEDIPGYMGAMEMAVKAASPDMLSGLSAGDTIDFELQRAGSKLTITKLTKTGSDPAVAGALVYKENCAVCHGDTGEGRGKKGIPLTSGHALDHTEAQMIDQVIHGEDDEMPAFKDKLSDEQIKQVVAFVRNTLQAGKPRDLGHHH